MIGARLSGTVFAKHSNNIIGFATLAMNTRPQITKDHYDLIDAKTGILRNQSENNLFHTIIERIKNNINSFESGRSTRRGPWIH